MNIKTFKHKKYDADKITRYADRVEEKIERVEKANFNRWLRYVKMFENDPNGLQPQYFHEHGFCTFCGAIRPSGEIGVGCGCEKIIRRFLEGYIHEFVEIPQQYKDDYLDAYKRYAKYARALYLYHNTKNGDMKTLKAFRNQFKKSFAQSLLDNKEARLSKKQLEIIEKDAKPYTKDCGSAFRSYYVDVKEGYEKQLEEYRKYVFRKFYYEKGYGAFKEQIFNSFEFGLYCRIQVSNAWVN